MEDLFDQLFPQLDDETLIEIQETNPKMLHNLCLLLSLDIQMLEEETKHPDEYLN
jgi:hypothetical protein